MLVWQYNCGVPRKRLMTAVAVVLVVLGILVVLFVGAMFLPIPGVTPAHA